MARPDFRKFRKRWLAFTAVLLAVAGGLGALGGVGQPDHLVADALRRFDVQERRQDIVVVAIDDVSLRALGPLPWGHQAYARLLHTLADARPRVIGISSPWGRRYLSVQSDEHVLAEAVKRAGNVVLPVAVNGVTGRQPIAVLPSKVLSGHAEAIGHIHTQLDADGMARMVALRAGPLERPWEHMALAMYRVGSGDAAVVADRSRLLPDELRGSNWTNSDRMLVPFPRERVQRVSFVDVITGKVPAEQLRNRYVLVGATAPGVGNAFSTPAAAPALLPETDLIAAVLQALLDQHFIQEARPGLNAVVNMLPAFAAALALGFLPTGLALVTVFSIAGLFLLVTAWLPVIAGVQIYPVAGLFALLLAFPVWMVLRVIVALRKLSREMRDVPISVLPPDVDAVDSGNDDIIGRPVGRVQEVIRQLKVTQALLQDSLDAVPDLTFIADERGRVLMMNAAARTAFAAAGALPSVSLQTLSAALLPAPAQLQVAEHFRDRPRERRTLEITDHDGRHHLVRVIPRTGPDGTEAGWVISVVDDHSGVSARRQRDDALTFMSHDMRSPLSSVLSLIELHELGASKTQDVNELLARIKRYARTGMDLSEDYVQLASAELGNHRAEPEDLNLLLAEAADLLWKKAESRGIRIVLADEPAPAMAEVDRGLMTRALRNLMESAVRVSPDNTSITCDVQSAEDGRHWQVSVRDEGPGIAVSDIDLMFEKFRRSSGERTRVEGSNLAMAFVKAVVVAHGGTIRALNCTEQGAEFMLCIPKKSRIRGTDASNH